MWVFDDWHDWVRLANGFMCLVSLSILAHRFAKNHDTYNVKTRDLWYSLVVWCVVGLALSINGIIKDVKFGSMPMFVLVGSLVTLKGTLRKGSWGSDDGN